MVGDDNDVSHAISTRDFVADLFVSLRYGSVCSAGNSSDIRYLAFTPMARVNFDSQYCRVDDLSALQRILYGEYARIGGDAFHLGRLDAYLHIDSIFGMADFRYRYSGDFHLEIRKEESGVLGLAGECDSLFAPLSGLREF